MRTAVELLGDVSLGFLCHQEAPIALAVSVLHLSTVITIGRVIKAYICQLGAVMKYYNQFNKLFDMQIMGLKASATPLISNEQSADYLLPLLHLSLNFSSSCAIFTAHLLVLSSFIPLALLFLCLPQNLHLFLFIAPLVILTSLPELIDTSIINSVHPALVQGNEINDIIAKSGKTMECGHFDSECKEIVNEGVKESIYRLEIDNIVFGIGKVLVDHGLPRHMGDRFELIVDVE